MAGNSRFAAGYFFLGLSLGASLATQEIAARRPNTGDIRGRTTGSPQARRQSPAAPGTPLRHGPDKFISANNYSAEQSFTVHSRPARPQVKPTTPKSARSTLVGEHPRARSIQESGDRKSNMGRGGH